MTLFLGQNVLLGANYCCPWSEGLILLKKKKVWAPQFCFFFLNNPPCVDPSQMVYLHRLSIQGTNRTQMRDPNKLINSTKLQEPG